MDDADRATDQSEKLLEASISNKRREKARPREIGYCHFCLEPISAEAENKLFCDADCASDWEKEEATIRRQGS